MEQWDGELQRTRSRTSRLLHDTAFRTRAVSAKRKQQQDLQQQHDYAVPRIYPRVPAWVDFPRAAPVLPAHDMLHLAAPRQPQHQAGAHNTPQQQSRGAPLTTLVPPEVSGYHVLHPPRLRPAHASCAVPKQPAPGPQPWTHSNPQQCCCATFPPPNSYHRCPACACFSNAAAHAPPPLCLRSPARKDRGVRRLQHPPGAPLPTRTACCQAHLFPVPDAINQVEHLGVLTHATTCACCPQCGAPSEQQAARPLWHVVDQLRPVAELPTLTAVQARLDTMHWRLQHALEVRLGWQGGAHM